MVTIAVKVSSAAFVASTGWSGLAIGGFVSGAIATVTAVGVLWATLHAAKRARLREYADEIRAAREEGAREVEQQLRPEIERLTDDRNYWRNQSSRRARGDG